MKKKTRIFYEVPVRYSSNKFGMPTWYEPNLNCYTELKVYQIG